MVNYLSVYFMILSLTVEQLSTPYQICKICSATKIHDLRDMAESPVGSGGAYGWRNTLSILALQTDQREEEVPLE